MDMIQALNTIAPGMTNDDTLLYGVEVKFYSSRLRLSNELETQVPNIFAIGDAGAAMRLVAGRCQRRIRGAYDSIVWRAEKRVRFGVKAGFLWCFRPLVLPAYMAGFIDKRPVSRYNKYIDKARQ